VARLSAAPGRGRAHSAERLAGGRRLNGTIPISGAKNATLPILAGALLADDPVAADATCSRLMGFEPDRVVHLREGSRFLGNASPALIDQVGESVNAPATPFQAVPEFRHLYDL